MRIQLDLIVHNAKIWIGKDHFVSALAVAQDRIAVMGSDAKILPLRKNHTRMIDAGGRLLLPGFNDAHVHFIEGGFQLLSVDLRDAADQEEFCRRLQQKAQQLPKGTWITGGYWDHERWPDKKLPSKELIDRVVPDHPVFVVRLDWHIGCANSLALQLAGIDRYTQSPSGGVIDHDPITGEPTGILRETAQRLIEQARPAPNKAQTLEALETALQHAAQLGVTSIQGACKADELQLYQELIDQQRLTLRVSAWDYINQPSDIETLQAQVIRHPYLRTGTAKLFCDGSFGASTAWLWQPYEFDAQYFGVAVHEPNTFLQLVEELHRRGRSMCIHAIGDRAVSLSLDALEAAMQRHGNRNARHRIEHAQMVCDVDVSRFASLGVIASIQPSHAIDDMRWIEERIGGRARTAYRFQSFLQAGVAVAIGSDWTVEPLDPMLNLYAAVTREYPQGGPIGGWQPQEKVSLEEVLIAYTQGSAFAEGTERDKGRLLPGYYADFVILSDDLFQLPPSQWLQTKAEWTVVGGRVVFERSSSQ